MENFPEMATAAKMLGEIRHSVGSRARAMTELRLREAMPLEQGLEDLVAWFRAGQPALTDTMPALGRPLEHAQP